MSDVLRYNCLQEAHRPTSCALPSCKVTIRAGSAFCPIHWQRDLVHRIACYKHNVGCVLKVQTDIAAYRSAWRIAQFGSDIDVASFVSREMTKEMQTRFCLSDVDLGAIQRKATEAA